MAALSVFQRFGHKLEQCFRGRIVRQTKTGVEFRVVGLPRREAFVRNSGTFQDSLEARCLRGGIRMVGDVQDEKRGDPFVLRHVIDRGLVAVFR